MSMLLLLLLMMMMMMLMTRALYYRNTSYNCHVSLMEAIKLIQGQSITGGDADAGCVT